ncbi:MAG: Asp-tRNA(Asn)/Glu-tRNA(Gln) amidotransferase subunit GatA [Christensenellales bacterium]
MSKEITGMTIAQLAAQLRSGGLSAKEIAESYLQRIDNMDSVIGAYITVDREGAIARAEQVDQMRRRGEELPPLAGIPGGIKDNICTKGLTTTCASKMLEHFVPPYDAFVMSKLNRQHFVMLGKTNMDEFAMGTTTESSYFKKTKNPHNTAHVPGGSSGGSAAAVAAREALFALGTDTGGSIRQPAAFCGVVGMKPTYGAVSRYGAVALASSLDQVGPMAGSVEECGLVLNAIMGYDRQDSTSVDREYGDVCADLNRGVKGLRIALPKEYFGEGLDKEVKEKVLAAAKAYEGMGAQIVEVSMPSLAYVLPAYYVLSSAEASSNLARFDGVKYGFQAEGCEDIEELYKKSRSYGFGREVKRRIMLGSFVLSAGYYDAYYKKAMQVRTLVIRDFERIFERCDVMLSPVTTRTAYRLGEKIADPLEMYRGDVYAAPVNIAGLPALSLPCGVDQGGLPIGMQLVGRAFDEGTLLRVGYAFEQAASGREA